MGLHCSHCVTGNDETSGTDGKSSSAFSLVLVGNPNVGKSVLFNQLTGAHQIIGNWPGKTVQSFKGRLIFEEKEIDLVDLPGTYSISSEIGEERQVREYLTMRKPDLVINVVDSTFLERNLALTIELLSLDIPVILCLNQIDRAEKQGLRISSEKLERELGIPVIPTSGLKGIGITDLLKVGLEAVTKQKAESRTIFHTPHIMKSFDAVRGLTASLDLDYPKDWLTERLLIGDGNLENIVRDRNPAILRSVRAQREALEREMNDEISSILSADRFALAAGITSRVTSSTGEPFVPLEEKVHNLLTHRIFGILLLAVISLSAFYLLFTIGDFFATLMIDQFDSLRSPFISLFPDAKFGEFLWNGLLGGVISVLTIALPYLIPFFIFLAILEDTGYIARVAFVMDSILHRIGLHGKAFIPMLLGYSCNVPACMGCRILETERERLLSIFAVTLIPCAATSIVILGLVGTYVGFHWVVALYLFNLLIVALLTRLAFSVLPGEPTGLIMEMPPLRRPSFKLVLRQSWYRVKDFIYIAIPLLIVVGLLLGTIQYFELFDEISDAMSPITEAWLGLPGFIGILLIFGILRKELTLLLLVTVSVAFAGTANVAEVLSDVQMIVFTLIVMLYIPCIATIGALVKEIGAKKAAIISVFEVVFALVVGGIAYRVLSAFM